MDSDVPRVEGILTNGEIADEIYMAGLDFALRPSQFPSGIAAYVLPLLFRGVAWMIRSTGHQQYEISFDEIAWLSQMIAAVAPSLRTGWKDAESVRVKLASWDFLGQEMQYAGPVRRLMIFLACKIPQRPDVLHLSARLFADQQVRDDGSYGMVEFAPIVAMPIGGKMRALDLLRVDADFDLDPDDVGLQSPQARPLNAEERARLVVLRKVRHAWDLMRNRHAVETAIGAAIGSRHVTAFVGEPYVIAGHGEHDVIIDFGEDDRLIAVKKGRAGTYIFRRTGVYRPRWKTAGQDWKPFPFDIHAVEHPAGP